MKLLSSEEDEGLVKAHYLIYSLNKLPSPSYPDRYTIMYPDMLRNTGQNSSKLGQNSSKQAKTGQNCSECVG